MCDKEQHNPVSGLFSTHIFNILAVAQKTKVDVAPERERRHEREWGKEIEITIGDLSDGTFLVDELAPHADLQS